MIPNQNLNNFQRLFCCFIAASIVDPCIIKSVCDLIRSSGYDDHIKAQLLNLYALQCADVGINKDIFKLFNENEVKL